MRRYAKKDTNHRALASELQQRGVDVIDLSAAGELPDLLCRKKGIGEIGLIEVKPEGRGTYTLKQLRFMARTTFPVAICQTVDEAMEFLRTGQGLTDQQKGRLAVFCERCDKVKVNSEQIEAVLKVERP